MSVCTCVDSDLNPDSDSDSDSDPDSAPGSDPHSDADPDSDSDLDPDPDSDSDSDIGPQTADRGPRTSDRGPRPRTSDRGPLFSFSLSQSLSLPGLQPFSLSAPERIHEIGFFAGAQTIAVVSAIYGDRSRAGEPPCSPREREL